MSYTLVVGRNPTPDRPGGSAINTATLIATIIATQATTGIIACAAALEARGETAAAAAITRRGANGA